MKTGILLVNLGSPDSTAVPDVRRYLREFLMDENVIDSPFLVRSLVVKGFILPFRPKKSAEAYRSIWWPEGSPLKVISERVKNRLQQRLETPLALAMRYANPSIEAGLKELLTKIPDLEHVFVIPLYPQYAMSSTKTVIDKTREVIAKNQWKFTIGIQSSFYNEENYIHALTASIKPYTEENYDHYLFSYHGLPERHIRKTDITGHHCLQSEDCCQRASEAHRFCYRHQCFETTRLVTSLLGLKPEQFSISFQSRLGRDPWLQPNTAVVLEELPQKGIKKLAVVCPAFVSDCLETLEEIAERGKESFLQKGGEKFVQVPCLNENEAWIDTLELYCREHLKQVRHA